MKLLKYCTVLAILALGLAACGSSGPSEADIQAEAEADLLDSTTQVINQVMEEVENDATELEAALDSLDVLFPEEEQQ